MLTQDEITRLESLAAQAVEAVEDGFSAAMLSFKDVNFCECDHSSVEFETCPPAQTCVLGSWDGVEAFLRDADAKGRRIAEECRYRVTEEREALGNAVSLYEVGFLAYGNDETPACQAVRVPDDEDPGDFGFLLALLINHAGRAQLRPRGVPALKRPEMFVH